MNVDLWRKTPPPMELVPNLNQPEIDAKRATDTTNDKPRASSLESGANATISEPTSIDGDTMTDEGIVRRLKIAPKTENTQEKAEERRIQREKECVGGGFLNSSWIAAIDNAGEMMCLHTSDSVQLIPCSHMESNISQ